MAWILPQSDQLEKLFSDLLGQKATVSLGQPLSWNSPDAFSGAVYGLEDGGFGAGAIYDVRFAAYMAAAITVTAPCVAEDAITTGVVNSYMCDALSEIMNVTAGLLNTTCPTHLVLKEAYSDRRKVPDKVKTFFRDSSKDVGHWVVTVPRYGTGRLSVFRV
ncbi:Uncharacterized protein SCG7086_AP_00100 [Chlamydiales bacterium SCGC AG-110-P3]|nr:Uncharacterized protein SCG7086_AP_00100 [Chlamydiales bacterium SCGC AG-110-P3]